MIATLFALVSGEALLNALLYIVIWAIIMWVLWWGLGKVGLPEPFHKIAVVILVLITVVVLINILLGIAGHPLISWHS